MKEPRQQTPYMIGLRDRILTAAMTAFAKNGIKAVKMDDVAKMLGISKRTLYEVYENKEVLLYEGVKKFKQLRQEQLAQLASESSNVIDMIIRVYRIKVEEFHQVSPEFYADIRKYQMVTDFLQADSQQAHDRFVGFLQRGVDEGCFRSDVDMNLVSVMFTAVTEHIMQHQLYYELSMEQIFHNFVFVTLRGICTEKGVALLNRYAETKE